MSDLVYLAASDLALPELTDAVNQAFEGYLVPMHHTPETLSAMVRTNDIRLDISLVAQTPEGALAGIGLLGVRGDRGWIGGMAVAPKFRGRGQGAVLLDVLTSRAKGLGVKTLQLEVLEENEHARRLYVRHGFEDLRPLAVYTSTLATPMPAPLTEDAVITHADMEELLSHYAATHSAVAPWQREEASLRNMGASLEAYALEVAGRLRAYVLAMPSGPGYSVMDFGSAGATAEARAHDGAILISHLATHAHSGPIRVINVPPGDALGPALDACGCRLIVKQREMALHIDLAATGRDYLSASLPI